MKCESPCERCRLAPGHAVPSQLRLNATCEPRKEVVAAHACRTEGMGYIHNLLHAQLVRVAREAFRCSAHEALVQHAAPDHA